MANTFIGANFFIDFVGEIAERSGCFVCIPPFNWVEDFNFKID